MVCLSAQKIIWVTLALTFEVHAFFDTKDNIDRLVQDCSISIANALEILQCCTKPSICWLVDLDPRGIAYWQHNLQPIKKYCHISANSLQRTCDFDLIQCKPDISWSRISRNWIYRGRMLDPIFWRPRARYFSRNRGNSLDPIRGRQFFAKSAHRDSLCSRFAGDNFSRNQLKPTCQCGLEHMLCDGQPR